MANKKEDKKEITNKDETVVKKTEEVVSEVETKSAAAEVTQMGLYNANGGLVRIFDSVSHGKDFKKIAEAHAKKLEGGKAKVYVDEAKAVKEKTVCRIIKGNVTVRTFALSTHGKDYKKIAEAYIEKYGKVRGYKIG